MVKLVIFGGHPKGYDKPFHPKTKSGKILRGILLRQGLDIELSNLWENQKEEDNGRVSPKKLSEISEYYHNGYTIITVGKHMHRQLKKQVFHGIDVYYLPHPASRTKECIDNLEHGLIFLSFFD